MCCSDTILMEGEKACRRQAQYERALTQYMPRLNPHWKTTFLDALRAGHTVGYAARLAGVSRPAAYQHRDRSPQFARQWDEALQEGLDNLLELIRARAVDISDKASAQLLMFLVKVRLSALSHSEDNVDIV